jgi:cytochrome c553
MHPTRLLALAAAVSALGAQAAPPQLENKIAQCQGCHGIVDWKTAFPEVYRVPKLGGQKPGYIVSALKAYRSGERDFATMRAIAADLTDQDMEQLAQYYAGEGAKTAATTPAATNPTKDAKK